MEPLNALAQIGDEDAAPGTVGATMPTPVLPQLRNLAVVDDVHKFIQEQLVRLVQDVRRERRPLEDEWSAIRNMELLQHDSGRRYLGRANSYVPVYNRILATITSSLSKGCFPSDEYMDVVDRSEIGDKEKAKAVKGYMQWEFERNGKVRQNIKPFLRQFANYGNSVLKFWYEKKTRYEGRIKNVADVARLMRPKSTFQGIQSDGLKVSTRSIYNFYMHPITAGSMEEAELIFEDIQVPYSYIEKMARLKKWVNVEAAMDAYDSEAKQNDQLQMSANNLTTTTTHDVGRQLGSMRTITECWTFMKLPKDQYVPGEDPECPLPVRIILACGVPVEVMRNPYWHQRPPYLLGRQNTTPGLIYGNGFGRAVRHMQYLANDFMNQTLDCGSYTLNPVTKVNPGKLAGPLRPLAPGVTWYMTDMDGAEFDRPPAELIQYGTQLINMVIGMAQDFGGAPPVLQGTGAGKGAKTATGAQILQRNAMAPLQDVVEDLELDVLIPLLHGAWVNAQQYRDEAVMALVGGMPLKISPEQLAIDADFRWLASSQAANQQQRAQQAMQLIQAVAPVVPMLMQQGYVVDFEPLIKRAFSDGMGFRGFDQFIHKAVAMGNMPPGAAPGPQQMGGIQQEQQDRVRSTLDQLGQGIQDVQPGEGGDFMSMRADADQNAGDMGGNNGQF